MSQQLQPLETEDLTETDDVFHTQSDSDNQFLSFELDQEYYCVDILSVSEIRGWSTPTILPNSLEYIKGVINIRGNIIPVIDLRIKLGLEPQEYNKETVVIILNVMQKSNQKTIGIVVDSVSDVFNCSDDDIKPPPETMQNINTAFIRGLCDTNELVTVVLDVEKLLDLNPVQEYYQSL
ncbi:chemotaxis protein CheW [Pleionea sediminis]|uniref:chemotaxis protein CheW n=1 Tax=Pleionea sediminis TaxID=2569479 RepID=UPI001186F2A3|nr:chemotaxis protein CheW [Pleionea sediminis]